MKKFLTNFVFLLVVLAVGYHFRSELRERLLPVFESARSYILPEAPCVEPIPYALGTFDMRFNISKSYFLSALTDAEAIWEKPSGIDLFTHIDIAAESSYDTLKVNLIYDYRQQATSTLSNIGITVENNKASYEALKAKFTALKADYENEKRDYDARVKAFNRSDRTDVEEFKSLQREQKNLNDMVNEINALVVVLNRLVATLNLSVEKYNTTNVARGESFEEGVYYKDAMGEGIDIYEFSSRDKLVRVLAHELGHALGFEHVDDAKAIMYKLNQGSSTTLSAADLSALKAHCGIQ